MQINHFSSTLFLRTCLLSRFHYIFEVFSRARRARPSGLLRKLGEAHFCRAKAPRHITKTIRNSIHHAAENIDILWALWYAMRIPIQIKLFRGQPLCRGLLEVWLPPPCQLHGRGDIAALIKEVDRTKSDYVLSDTPCASSRTCRAAEHRAVRLTIPSI